ncbi:MAG: alpha/beta fold hydrolase [Bacteroidota bacterium]
MKLHFKKIGEGRPVIILHGLFGSGDNWATFAKHLAENNFAVYITDLRNHGHSEWDIAHDYKHMAADVHEMIEDEILQNVTLIGHSMGGKAAMQVAVDFPGDLHKLIVADIAPRFYEQHHQSILKGLQSLNFDQLKTRGEADKQLSLYIDDIGTRQFLLKNLYWKENDKLALRFNLEVLSKEIENVGKEITSEKAIEIPTLFIAGEKSKYISEGDHTAIHKIFPNAEIITIPGAGHWIHADQPEVLLKSVISFLQND